MCTFSQLKSCQGAGAYKLQAADKEPPFLSGGFPLHLLCTRSPVIVSPFSLFHHCTSINQSSNGKAVCSGIRNLSHVRSQFLPLKIRTDLFTRLSPLITQYFAHLGCYLLSWIKVNWRAFFFFQKSIYNK